jgi:ribosome-binding ATPase
MWVSLPFLTHFCTIEPNIGIVVVPDKRLNAIAEIACSIKVIPSSMEFVDIAGLVEGASKGEGLGNKFLAHIRETAAIAHVVRCFHDDNITHVSGNVDPISDIEVIETELALADLESCTRGLERAEKQAKSGDKDQKLRVQSFKVLLGLLEAGTPVRAGNLEDEEGPALLAQEMALLTAKPLLFVANVAEDELQGSDEAAAVIAYAEKIGAECIVLCASVEAEIAALPEDERGEFLSDLGIAESGLDQVIRAGHHLLGLQNYFTAGPKESRAWTVPIGARAPQAAGVIHTDFERGFIRAEVIAYQDFIEYKGESKARELGKLRVEGKEYVVKDGDVMHFRFNV